MKKPTFILYLTLRICKLSIDYQDVFFVKLLPLLRDLVTLKFFSPVEFWLTNLRWTWKLPKRSTREELTDKWKKHILEINCFVFQVIFCCFFLLNFSTSFEDPSAMHNFKNHEAVRPWTHFSAEDAPCTAPSIFVRLPFDLFLMEVISCILATWGRQKLSKGFGTPLWYHSVNHKPKF